MAANNATAAAAPSGSGGNDILLAAQSAYKKSPGTGALALHLVLRHNRERRRAREKSGARPSPSRAAGNDRGLIGAAPEGGWGFNAAVKREWETDEARQPRKIPSR